MAKIKTNKVAIKPRIIVGGIILIVVTVILTVIFIISNSDDTFQPELHRSLFYVSGSADNAGGICQSTSVDNTDYCINPGSLNGVVFGMYKIDASYRFGAKTFQSSTNPPSKETLPTIFIETVHSITKVDE